MGAKLNPTAEQFTKPTEAIPSLYLLSPCRTKAESQTTSRLKVGPRKSRHTEGFLNGHCLSYAMVLSVGLSGLDD